MRQLLAIALQRHTTLGATLFCKIAKLQEVNNITLRQNLYALAVDVINDGVMVARVQVDTRSSVNL